MYRILVIDDEPENGKMIQVYGQHLGHDVTILTDPLGVIEHLGNHNYDLILLDVMMPDLSGLELIKQITNITSAKIIFISALGETSERIAGLRLGAVDYIPKPFSLEELFIKIDIVLGDRSNYISGFKFDPNSHTVTTENQIIKLTNTLYNLLFELVSHQGQVLSREYLLQTVWGITTMDYNRTVDTHILKLRNKLGSDSYKIVTVIGKGYKYEDEI